MTYDFEKPERPEVILASFVKALVAYPEEVEIDVQEAEHTIVLTIDVIPEDRGKIIGKQGAIFKSLQTLFKALGGKMKRQLILQIKES